MYTPPNKNIINVRMKYGDNKFKEMCVKCENDIKQAFCEFPDYGKVCDILLEIGDDHHLLAEKCHMKVGIPVKPMLAMPTKGV